MGGVPGAAGRVVAVPLGAFARRRRGKPMHAPGAVFEAVLDRFGSRPAWGVPWLDEPAREAVVVRLSRGAGLPPALPDLLGLALRLPGGDGGPVDLLLSSSGTGTVTRFVPVLRRNAATGYGSLMGYRSGAGTLRLAARPESPPAPSDPGPLVGEVVRRGLVFVLAAARDRADWRPFARLTLVAPTDPVDPDVRFDAVRNPPPGLVPDGPMARFRAPAYARAQAERVAARASAQASIGRPV
jgi:hypothetical protein